jgi:transposase InsO family protein
MRKTNKQPQKNYTEMQNLINAPLTWTPSTADKFVNPNHTISVDWGIVNKRNKAGLFNVFALFLDVHTGLVFVFPAESRGQAGDALKSYIQRYGKPHTLIHDNAKEFTDGEFETICKDQGIQQQRSPPYEPNKNPVEHYMEIILSMTRSMLYISGLDPDTFWSHAIEHAAYLQTRSALPGRCTPFELSYGRRPNMGNLRIFGCEALSYIEKEKRPKFQPKVERTIYLGTSPDHSEDTYKLYRSTTKDIIFRRNAYFNERSFPGRKLQTIPNLQDNGTDLIGVDFEDDGIMWTVTKTGNFQGNPVLHYVNKENGEDEFSSVKEVRAWCHQTTLKQAINSIKPTRKGYINTLAEESFKAIKTYNLNLPPNSTKPTSYKKAGNQP